MKFTEQQKQIIFDKNSSNILIIAGPGTGKTTLITERVKFLIENKLIKAEEILITTFTNKSLNLLYNSVLNNIPNTKINFYTISSLFIKILNEVFKYNIYNNTLISSIQLTMDIETKLILYNQYNKFKISNYFNREEDLHKYLFSIVQSFNRIIENDINHQDIINYIKSNPNWKWTNNIILKNITNRTIVEIFKLYKSFLWKNKTLDFSPINGLLKTLLEDPLNIGQLKMAQSLYKLIIIDEYQDINILQNKILSLLIPSKSKAKIIALGDINQNIYAFRGTSTDSINTFQHIFDNTKIYNLNENFRSTKNILDLSQSLIMKPKPIKSIGYGMPIYVLKESNYSKLSQYINSLIIELISSGFTIKDDIGILSQSIRFKKKLVQEITDNFDKNNIGYIVHKKSDLFGKDIILVAIDIIQSIDDYLHNTDKSKKTSLINKIQYCFKKHKSLNIVIDDKIVSNIEDLVNKMSDPNSKCLEIFYMVYDILININSTMRYIINLEYINICYIINLGFYADNVKLTIHELMNTIKILRKKQNLSSIQLDKPNKVTITTVHDSKGLEYDVVFLIDYNFSEFNQIIDLPPSDLTKSFINDNDDNISNMIVSESMRLFYVAVTRPKKLLFLIYTDEIPKEINDRVQVNLIQRFNRSDFIKQLNLHNKGYKKSSSNIISKLSFSSISTFEECSFKYKLKYIYLIKELERKSNIIGSAVHKIIEHINFLIRNNNFFNKDEDIQFNINSILKLYSTKKNNINYESNMDIIKIMILNYIHIMKNIINNGEVITHIEYKCSLLINSSTIDCIIDFITKDKEGNYIINEIKTGKENTKHLIQLKYYISAYKYNNDNNIVKSRILYLSNKQIIEYSSKNNPELFTNNINIGKRINQIKEYILNETAPSTNPIKCSKCNLNKVCIYRN